MNEETYISRIKTKNYWWSKIKGRLMKNIYTSYNNGMSRNNKSVRWYNKPTI